MGREIVGRAALGQKRKCSVRLELDLFERFLPTPERAAGEIVKGRADRAGLQPIVMCLACNGWINRPDGANRLRKHLHTLR